MGQTIEKSENLSSHIIRSRVELSKDAWHFPIMPAMQQYRPPYSFSHQHLPQNTGRQNTMVSHENCPATIVFAHIFTTCYLFVFSKLGDKIDNDCFLVGIYKFTFFGRQFKNKTNSDFEEKKIFVSGIWLTCLFFVSCSIQYYLDWYDGKAEKVKNVIIKYIYYTT